MRVDLDINYTIAATTRRAIIIIYRIGILLASNPSVLNRLGLAQKIKWSTMFDTCAVQNAHTHARKKFGKNCVATFHSDPAQTLVAYCYCH